MADAALTLDTPRVFLPLLERSRYKGAWGGRGSGKSHFFAELLVEYALSKQNFRAVCVREVQKSLKESVKRLVEDKIRAMGVAEHFNILNDQIGTPGGGVILFQGMQDHTAESIKSLEGMDVAWVEEAQTLSARSLEMLRPTIRSAGSELWFSWNPRSAQDPVDQMLRGLEPPKGAIVVKANWSDNPFFPAELADEREDDYRKKPGRYLHIWEGAYEPMAVGAIWDRNVLHSCRVTEAPTLKRIVVAIDPATSSEPGSDEHGIIVAGVGEDQRGYVLEDATLKGTPQAWAQQAVRMYDAFDADAIIIERNQGGDMCRHTLQSVRPNIRIIEVTATRGKHVRAEPISALYHLGKVSHVGTYPELEQQMCQMTAAGYEGDGSPDRCDALVWALTELFPSVIKKAQKAAPTIKRAPISSGWMGA